MGLFWESPIMLWHFEWIPSRQLYIYIYMHIHTYVHACIHTCTYIYMDIHTYVHACIHICIYIYAYTYVRTCMHTYMYIYIYMHIHMYVHACIHTCTYIYAYTYVRTCMHTYMYIYIYMHIHTYVHACIHTCTYIYIHEISPVRFHGYFHLPAKICLMIRSRTRNYDPPRCYSLWVSLGYSNTDGRTISLVSEALDRGMLRFKKYGNKVYSEVMGFIEYIYIIYIYTWWLIPLSKWVITPVISGLTLFIPFITGVITHLLSGMSHQVYISNVSQFVICI